MNNVSNLALNVNRKIKEFIRINKRELIALVPLVVLLGLHLNIEEMLQDIQFTLMVLSYQIQVATQEVFNWISLNGEGFIRWASLILACVMGCNALLVVALKEPEFNREWFYNTLCLVLLASVCVLIAGFSGMTLDVMI